VALISVSVAATSGHQRRDLLRDYQYETDISRGERAGRQTFRTLTFFVTRRFGLGLG